MASSTSLLDSHPVFGTLERDDDSGSMVYDSVKAALKAGYRRFDLAERYTTTDQVGRALSESKIPRDELFIVSKIDGLPCGSYETVKARVEAMLQPLPGIGHFDLLLIHHPLIQGADLSAEPSHLLEGAWEYFQDNILDAWKNMTLLQSEGLAATVGVSNFYLQHLNALDKAMQSSSPLELAPIAAVEVFVDVSHAEEELVVHCQTRDPPAAVLAYRPLAFIPALEFLECDAQQDTGASAESATTTLLAALESRAKSLPGCADARQLVLAWLHARGISPVTSSTNLAHIISNLEAVGVSTGTSFLDAFSQSNKEPIIPRSIIEQSDMVSMLGGCDEYAAAFASMGVK